MGQIEPMALLLLLSNLQTQVAALQTALAERDQQLTALRQPPPTPLRAD